MNRRNALKNITLGMGAVVATPAIMSILSSCTEEAATWKPLFLSNEEQNIVTHLADIILPATDIPGALDVNVPQFIDKMFNDIESDDNKEAFQKGAAVFADRIGGNAAKASKQKVETTFEQYFKLSDEASAEVKKSQRQASDKVAADQLDDYLMYKFLFGIKSYALFGYFTSKKVGTEVLNYDPVPGKWEPCVPLADIGNAWSL